MNKNLKSTLFVINLAVILLSVFWFFSEKGYEPVIVFISQIGSILLMSNESKFSKTSITDISNGSEIDIREKRQSISSTKIEGVENSKVKINKG
ncbi:hypothetical protein V2595_15555 [Tenacibaculum maritimum]|uniref:hypothetical protein n=1 Tax=Tenacibaculum maritimum TaxID=107401 RepID=UPI0012E57E14|nr:hypothetical protein [Tenacibaculum maritimum]CAA0227922.1 hypothetical protein DPIF89300162_510015 [Tenacibaculum maritimum]